MPSTLDFQSYDKSNSIAKAQLTPVFNAITDPFKATIGNDNAAQSRIVGKVNEAVTNPVAATFAGETGAFARSDYEGLIGKLEQAKHMLKGIARNTPEFYRADKMAWRETGWTHGFPDGKPRFEIPDSNAIVVGKNDTVSLGQYASTGISADMRNGNLQNTIVHPELFDTYPNFRKYRVSVNPSESGGFYEHGHIGIGNEDFEGPGILLHEIQHAVQEREGFARGGDEKEFFDVGYPEDEAYNKYKKLAGEVEARLTEMRMGYSSDLRKLLYPIDDMRLMGMPVEKQTVLPQGMSVIEYLQDKLRSK